MSRLVEKDLKKLEANQILIDILLQAGRIEAFDELASKFFSATADIRGEILVEAAKLAEEIGSTAAHYLKIMNKIIEKTDSYLGKESTRLASILKKRSLSDLKLDEIKVKANILSAFAPRKTEEVADEEPDVKESKAHEELQTCFDM